MKYSHCQASHIGETGRNLHTRLTEHKRATRNGDANNHIAVHHRLTNHNIDWDSAQCLIYSTNYFQRLTLESWYSVLPSFRPVPVSGQKKVNSVIFDGILTLRPSKQSVRKTIISASNWWFWWGFWSRNERTRRDFVQVSKILPANFWPFHCTAKLPYLNK